MRKLLLITLFLFTSQSIIEAKLTDEQKVDSLLALSKKASSTIEQIDLLIEVSSIYTRMHNTESKESRHNLFLRNINQARAVDYKKGLANALYYFGKYYISINNNPAKATPYFLESLDLFKKIDDSVGVAKCYMQLGVISYILQHFEAAVKNLQLSINAAKDTSSTYLLALSYTELDSFSLAKKYFYQSINHYTKSNNIDELNQSYLWLGRLYIKTKGIDSAFYYINSAIKNLEAVNNKVKLIRPYAFVSEVYFEANNIDRAIFYAQKSYELEEKKTTEQKDEIGLIQSTKILSKAYAVKKNYEKAHYYLDLFNKTNNRLTAGSIKQKVADMQSMFEFDQEMSLEKVRQQQKIANERLLRNGFLIGSALLLLLLILLYSRFNLKKKANNTLRKLNEVITAEKKRSDDLLLNILPADIAKELKNTGKAEASNFDLVSILFTDIKEFTQATEKLSAKELVAEINTCFVAFDHICEKYHIEKIKTIGDAYMAAGGLTGHSKNPVKDTVLAALEMQKFINDRKQSKEMENTVAFEIRAGIHTGNIVAGIVGVKKFQYDIWGDAVNTASRIESNGEVGKVNISNTTYNLIKDEPDFKFEHRGKIAAKGKGEIDMYFVSRV